MRSVLNDASATIFSDFLYKNICCGYPFELPRLVEAIQMSSHNICFYKENICCEYSFELPQLVEAIQMCSHNICFYKEVDKVY